MAYGHAADGGRPANWSRLNIALHWVVAALIIVQLLDHEGMVAWWHSFHGEGAASSTDVTLGWIHIAAGLSILAFAAVRMWDRAQRGRPPYSAKAPGWAVTLSRLTHALLFGILILMPLVGLTAWLTNSERLAHIHTFFWTPLLVLVGVHFAGALAEQFVLKTNALKRMLRRES